MQNPFSKLPPASYKKNKRQSEAKHEPRNWSATLIAKRITKKNVPLMKNKKNPQHTHTRRSQSSASVFFCFVYQRLGGVGVGERGGYHFFRERFLIAIALEQRNMQHKKQIWSLKSAMKSRSRGGGGLFSIGIERWVKVLFRSSANLTCQFCGVWKRNKNLRFIAKLICRFIEVSRLQNGKNRKKNYCGAFVK